MSALRGPAAPPDAAERRRALARLVAVAALLTAAFAAFWLFDLVDADDVRDVVDGFGPLAPLAYVAVAALLGAALVPGPILAATSGVLFGAALGTPVTIAASVLGAVLALLAARRAAGPAFQTLAGSRIQGIAALAERHGTAAVVVQRLAPGVPDAPCSYLFGAIGLRVWQIAAGTAIGAAPRAFSYTSLGASLDDPGSPLAYAAVAVLVVAGLGGAELSRRIVVRHRRDAARAAPRPPGPPA